MENKLPTQLLPGFISRFPYAGIDGAYLVVLGLDSQSSFRALVVRTDWPLFSPGTERRYQPANGSDSSRSGSLSSHLMLNKSHPMLQSDE